MEFIRFEKCIPKIKNLPLPGYAAHLEMAPLSRIRELEQMKDSIRQAKAAAVLAHFYPSETGITQLLLILRKSYPGVHSNQIAFPGGKRELVDSDLMQTALRETHEEVGIAPERIQVIKSLTEVYIPPSNFNVSPFLGVSTTPLDFRKQDAEVEAIVEVPLAEVLNEANIQQKKLQTSYSQQIEVPVFMLQKRMVWGATAMILNEIKTILKEVM